MSGKLLTDRAIVGKYFARLENGPSIINQLAMRVDSDQDSENHAWLGMPPALREWIGGKQSQELRENSFRIDNKDYESTMEYHERILKEDKTGQFDVRLGEHIQRVDALWSKLLANLIIGGEASTCYDGQYYFDTDHSEGTSGTQSNDITTDISELAVGVHGSTTAPSVSEMNEAIMKSIETMLGFKDDQGEPVNENAKEFLVVVPTPLWKKAVSAVRSPTIDQGDTNVVVSMDGFKINIHSMARLTWTDKFATFRTDGSVKPFIQQVREEPVIKILGEGSDHFFETRRKKVSIELAGAMGFGMWQQAVLNQLT